MVKDIQALCGYLNFLNRAIYPGRVFTRRMYAKYSGLVQTKVGCDRAALSIKYYPKPHHHIKLNAKFKQDCQVWLSFMEDSQLLKVVNRPMIDLSEQVTADQISFYSDASGSAKLGYGCVLGNWWLFGQWDEQFIKDKGPSIEYLELFALCAGLITWQSEQVLNDSRVIIYYATIKQWSAW